MIYLFLYKEFTDRTLMLPFHIKAQQLINKKVNLIGPKSDLNSQQLMRKNL